MSRKRANTLAILQTNGSNTPISSGHRLVRDEDWWLKDLRNELGIQAFRSLVFDVANGANTKRMVRKYGVSLWKLRIVLAQLNRAYVIANPVRLLFTEEGEGNDT